MNKGLHVCQSRDTPKTRCCMREDICVDKKMDYAIATSDIQYIGHLYAD